jgi:hypothetical protein
MIKEKKQVFEVGKYLHNGGSEGSMRMAMKGPHSQLLNKTGK